MGKYFAGLTFAALSLLGADRARAEDAVKDAGVKPPPISQLDVTYKNGNVVIEGTNPGNVSGGATTDAAPDASAGKPEEKEPTTAGATDPNTKQAPAPDTTAQQGTSSSASTITANTTTDRDFHFHKNGMGRRGFGVGTSYDLKEGTMFANQRDSKSMGTHNGTFNVSQYSNIAYGTGRHGAPKGITTTGGVQGDVTGIMNWGHGIQTSFSGHTNAGMLQYGSKQLKDVGVSAGTLTVLPSKAVKIGHFKGQTALTIGDDNGITVQAGGGVSTTGKYGGVTVQGDIASALNHTVDVFARYQISMSKSFTGHQEDRNRVSIGVDYDAGQAMKNLKPVAQYTWETAKHGLGAIGKVFGKDKNKTVP